MGYRVIIPPTAEHITLDEARLHLRLDAYDSPAAHPDDPLISALITTAREWAETFTGRAIAVVTAEFTLDCFPRYARSIALPKAPGFSVAFVRYFDTAGVERDLSGWAVDWYQTPPRVQLNPGASWPDSQEQKPNAIRIRFTAGYPGAGDSPAEETLPSSIKSAMLLVLAHLYENRENSTAVALGDIPLGAESLLRPFRLFGAV